jgi:XTP/dITP diphosphohydrolase
MNNAPFSELVIASHNAGKVREIAELLEPLNIKVYSATDLDLPEPEETGDTYAENAALKSLAAAQASGKVALADDSGLSVHDLDGWPGIYSARVAGPDKDFSLAFTKIWKKLAEKEITNAQASFFCVLSLAWPDGKEVNFTGEVKGHIISEQRGANGFGYDPIFIPEGYQHTFGEMEPAAKKDISHRADAFRQFLEWLKKRA